MREIWEKGTEDKNERERKDMGKKGTGGGEG